MVASGGQMAAGTYQAAATGVQTLATVDSVGQTEKLLELVERQSKQLQDASCRIGWLESQLQEREKEVKLLTDSRHKAKWWQRIGRWLAERQIKG